MAGDYEQPKASVFEKIKSWVIITLMRYAIEDPLEGTKRFRSLLPESVIQSGDTADPIAATIAAGTNGRLGLINGLAATRITASQWALSMQAADRHNEPGKFTALVGWEWSQIASGVNLHRIIVSDADGDTASGFDPVGSDDAPYPEQLWDQLDVLAKQTGADFISIPHNSNLSKGYMFAKTTVKGAAINAAYARKRSKWETLVEATQFKGDSETHPDLAPDDEFANFEQFDFYLQAYPQGLGYKIQKGDTVRSALKSGLELNNAIGVNPFKFGLIGSTDSHTGMASAEEPNFWEKPPMTPSPRTNATTTQTVIVMAKKA